MARATAWLRDRRGSVLIEFALFLPVFVVLVLGGVDIVRFIITNQKLDRVAGFVGDFVAREEALTEERFTEYFAAATKIADPLDIAANGYVIISGIGGGSGGEIDDADILWQQTSDGGFEQSSSVGAVGDAPDLPAPVMLEEGQGLIVTEIYFRFDPMFFPDFVGQHTLHYRAFHRPRRVDLLDIQS